MRAIHRGGPAWKKVADIIDGLDCSLCFENVFAFVLFYVFLLKLRKRTQQFRFFSFKGVKFAIVAILAKEFWEQSITQGLTTIIQNPLVTIKVDLKSRFRGNCV